MQAGGAITRRNYSFLCRPESQQPADVDWSALFDDPSKPLVVDLGCGAGRYILLMAHRQGPGKNYLGIDVHKALLDRANGWAAARRMSGHVRYLQAHAVLSAGQLLGCYPGAVELVSVQYPDPQQRRQRHMVGRELVEALARVLKPGARVYLTSDFEDTAAYMRNAFERYGGGCFRVDDEVHTTQRVFPCTPLTPPGAAAVADVGSGVAATGALAGTPVPATALKPPLEGEGGESGGGLSHGTIGNGGVCEGGGSGNSNAATVGAWSERHRGDSGGEEEEDLLAFQGSWQEAGWLEENPVGAPTEREVYVEKASKGRVYRVLLVRR
ncbi:hypothetical protein Agub_g10843 [Astrephomene gubernaculifera]|uniref:tRNA (guanine(46)-N(7))-methyltransferase n=1 Tax=Astrephomene gubernaculifera TaxID=47775 RepID=A0AAD3DVR1_9CHLO|nr:hypothetical protein Agub_g10843 [Astrephomene gubernaculifera]